jgi:copper chaperone CopZ
MGISLFEPIVAQTNHGDDSSTVHPGTSPIESDTVTYTVYGMDCPGCEGGLEKQVNKISSVKYSKANWYKQELKIVVKQDSLLSLEELEKRVKKANFTLEKEMK